MRHFALILLSLTLMSGCDRLAERMGMPDPAKMMAEGKAVGGACRHAGRGLEDCYKLNPTADKAAVYEGWKEMNEYMAKNNMQAVPPSAVEQDKGTRKAQDHQEEGEPDAGGKTPKDDANHDKTGEEHAGGH